MRVFARHLFTLLVDPVPNIRFNCAKTIGAFYPNFDNENQERARELLQRTADNDTDFDSKFYSQKTLDEILGRVAAEWVMKDYSKEKYKSVKNGDRKIEDRRFLSCLCL